MVVADPDRFFDLSGSAERYLSGELIRSKGSFLVLNTGQTVLRMLAANYNALSTTLRSRMKMSAFFLGTKRIRTTAQSTSKTLLDEDSDDEDGGTTTLVYQLSRASDLAVNDDPQGE